MTALVAAGAVGVTLALAGDDDPEGGEAASSAGDEGSGDDPASEMQTWTAPAVDGDHGEVIRTVAAGSDLIVVAQRDVTSIDRRTGEQNWFRSLEEDDEPGAQYVMCGAGTVASDGRLPVTLGIDTDPGGNWNPICGVVGLLDLSTGDVEPAVDLSAQGVGSLGVLNEGMPVEIVGDTVLATWHASIFGLDPADLSTTWRWDAHSEAGREGHLCVVNDLALGEPEHVVVMSSCVTDRGETLWFVDELSVTGEVGRTYQLTAEVAQVEVSSLDLVSAAPVVISVRPNSIDQAQPGTLVTLDESWNVLATIHDERTSLAPQALTFASVGATSNRTGAWRRQNRTLVSGNTLVSFTAPGTGTNELVAVDLRTGEQTWTAAPPSGSVFWQVLAIEDGAVTALASQNDGPAQSVVTVDLASGEVRDEATTEVIEPDGDPISGIIMANHGFLYADGRAYGVEHDDAGEPDEQWLAYTVG